MNLIMKHFIKVCSLLLLFSLATVTLQAQKFGYIDSNAILAEMAEVKEMRSKLESLKTQLQKQGQQMIQDYQLQEQEYVKKKERGELSRIQEEELVAGLQKKQEERFDYFYVLLMKNQ